MKKQIYKRFDIAITTAEQTYSRIFELDKTIHLLNGLLLVSDRDDLMYYRGSQRIEMNGDEIFPEDYESKLLMSGLNVSPNERYYDLGSRPVGNGKIKVSYKDTPTITSVFTPYRVSIYVDCEINEP